MRALKDNFSVCLYKFYLHNGAMAASHASVFSSRNKIYCSLGIPARNKAEVPMLRAGLRCGFSPAGSNAADGNLYISRFRPLPPISLHLHRPGLHLTHRKPGFTGFIQQVKQWSFGDLNSIPPELVRFLKNVPNGLIHPEMKRKIFPHYRPPPFPT